MQLSVLIPTHDYTCYKLVYDLQKQAEQLGIEYEIILAEDGSRYPVSMIANLKVKDLPGCYYMRQEQGLGPAGIRNMLAEKAKGEWIVFIDSDAKVESDDFLKNYIEAQDQADVIVGGIKTLDAHLNPEVSLRYRYETNADRHRGAEVRNKDPYAHFSTFNFMIRRSVFMQIMFDRECKDYGYEDALFGVELQTRGVGLVHIDNPLTHMGLDTNAVFLRKTETALRSLKGLNGRMRGKSHVENACNKVASLHLAWMSRLAFRMFGGLMKRNLLSANPSLFIFKLYKLGYYSTINK